MEAENKKIESRRKKRCAVSVEAEKDAVVEANNEKKACTRGKAERTTMVEVEEYSAE